MNGIHEVRGSIPLCSTIFTPFYGIEGPSKKGSFSFTGEKMDLK